MGLFRMMIQGVLIVCCLLFLQACTAESEAQQQRVYMLGDRYYTNTLNLFERAHPEIELDNLEKSNDGQENYASFLKKALEDELAPDFLLLPYETFVELRDEGWLAPLDPYLEESEVIQVDDLFPVVREALINPTDGQIYGIAHAFTSTVLIYNEEIFRRMGVSEPTDDMTWDEAFQLARQVTVSVADEPIYGFDFSPSTSGSVNFQDFYSYFVLSSGDDWLNEDQTKMEINVEGWIPQLKQLQALYREEVIPMTGSNLFQSGQLAMSLVTGDELYNVINLNENSQWIEDLEPVEFDIVNAPIHQQESRMRPLTDLAPVLVINAHADNPQQAWQYIEHTITFNWEYNSLQTTNLPTSEMWFERKAVSNPINLSHFIPEKIGEYVGYNDRRQSVMYSSLDIFAQAMSGQITIDEAIKQIEVAGNLALR